MKRPLIAMVLALAVACVIQQEASAWCKFNFSAGVNIGLETGGRYVKRGGYERYSFPPPYAQNYGGFGGYHGFAPPVPNAPAPTSEAPPAAAAPVQPAGYFYQPQQYYVSPALYYWYGD
jgi:hypothetical protein